MIVDGRDPEEFAHGHLVGADQRRAQRSLRRVRRIDRAERRRHRACRSTTASSSKPRTAWPASGSIGSSATSSIRSRSWPTIPIGCSRRRASTPSSSTHVEPRSRASSWSTSATRARSHSVPSRASVPIPVGQLPSRVDELDPTRPTVVFCAGGYRSSVAASVLRQRRVRGRVRHPRWLRRLDRDDGAVVLTCRTR